MVKIFGCDIGCKNLAYVIINIDDTHEKPINILYWEILNICTDECLCSKELRGGKHCCTKAQYIDKQTGHKFCTKHKPSDIKTNKISVKEKDSLSNYVLNMKNILDTKPYLLECDYYIIEKQPNRLNPMMQNISVALLTYLTIKTNKTNIYFNIASTKLKLNEPLTKEYLKDAGKNKYKITKKLGIGICKYILNFETDNYLDYYEYFSQHKKQDDLCDAFLHAYVYHYKINHFKNNKKMEDYIKEFMDGDLTVNKTDENKKIIKKKNVTKKNIKKIKIEKQIDEEQIELNETEE